jgi:hypothetical protein
MLAYATDGSGTWDQVEGAEKGIKDAIAALKSVQQGGNQPPKGDDTLQQSDGQSQKTDAVIAVADASITKVYGAKAFLLGVASNATLSYKSSNNKVATVSSNGIVSIVGCGRAKITVTASGSEFNETTKVVTIVVQPKKAVLKKLSSTKAKQLKITWEKDAKVTGYQVQYSTDKAFKKSVTETRTIKKYNTVSLTIGKMKSKKVYYVRVRSFKADDTANIYGQWSAKKAVRIK